VRFRGRQKEGQGIGRGEISSNVPGKAALLDSGDEALKTFFQTTVLRRLGREAGQYRGGGVRPARLGACLMGGNSPIGDSGMYEVVGRLGNWENGGGVTEVRTSTFKLWEEGKKRRATAPTGKCPGRNGYIEGYRFSIVINRDQKAFK